MDYKDILSACTGVNESGKTKSVVGFFVEERFGDATDAILEEFYTQRPVIEIIETLDDEDNEFCEVEFVYKSSRDEEFKKLWHFLERYIQRYTEVPEEEEKIPVLLVSIIPISLAGKYSIMAKYAIPELVSYTVVAVEKKCSIRLLFAANNVLFYEHDDDLINSTDIKAELEMELAAETAHQKAREITDEKGR